MSGSVQRQGEVRPVKAKVRCAVVDGRLSAKSRCAVVDGRLSAKSMCSRSGQGKGKVNKVRSSHGTL